MTTAALYKYRPMKPSVGTGFINFLRAINLVYWLQRAPMALLSSPAAYGVSAFAAVHLPPPFSWFAGMAFESVYLGCVALADQMFEQDKVTTWLWWGLNVIAVVTSALINVLYFSNNAFAGFTPEALVHGIPLPLLGFGYSLLLHKVTTKNIMREHTAQLEREKYERENPRLCICGQRFPPGQAVRNHRRTCEAYLESQELQSIHEHSLDNR